MEYLDSPPSALKRLNIGDWIYGLLVILGAAYGYYTYAMDLPEQLILSASALGLIALGWFWKDWRWFSVLSALLGLIANITYQGQIANGQTQFLLKYLLSSQSAIMWMCALFFLATVIYWIGFFARSASIAGLGSALTWIGALMGLSGLLVRWHESYLISPDIGHIPVSNLYEVFILFAVITTLMYLYYEKRYQTKTLGGFVLLTISAAVAFILWYTFDRQAQAIQPLIPALQSWWMKIHVPANFVGYGAFSIAAMLGIARLLVLHGHLTDKLPSDSILDEMMYKAIAVGFLFFTIATVLGAMWAADAWGGYWSWDPKETWALIVWLNYAAWLHIRLVKGWLGPLLSWWAIIGLLVVTFAFVGVNLFLSGLHSYGTL